jgi:hypothetical protein
MNLWLNAGGKNNVFNFVSKMSCLKVGVHELCEKIW